MAPLMFLAFAFISMMWMPAQSADTTSEAYWKMNLGNDVNMPKVVKEALLGAGNNKKFETNTLKDYEQSLSKAIYGIESSNNYETNVRSGDNNKWGKSSQPTQYYAVKGSKPASDDFVRYFLEKDLVYTGSKMKLHFEMVAKSAKFMPLEVANSVPFSSTKIPEILRLFAVSPKSTTANFIKEAIKICETKPVKGEQRSCATSLESIVNYAKSCLGKNIKALSTEVDKETEQEFKIKSARKIKNDKHLVCHKMVYPYAVFNCHTFSKTDVYQVSLIDSIGKNVKAVAVCHKDTSSFDAGHIAFQLLKVKPGGVPICHFLNPDAMIWVPK